MNFLTRLFGKPGKKIKELSSESDKEKDSAKLEATDTVVRPSVEPTRITRKKLSPEITALELAEKQDWQLKTLPVWQAGDLILDTYEVENVISGGMGHVYIANHKNWNVKLAIKSPNEMMLSEKDFFARILREANSWTELGLHPNIAYCYYVRNIEEVPHIIVEYVDGGNLRQWIEEGKCIDYRANLDLAIQFCHGMEHAHAKGMIHRDIKPENVLMTKDSILKITDFGLVRENGTDHSQGSPEKGELQQPAGHGLTTVGTLMGTEGYMAPEQAESAGDVDERADIFSFGVCLYEMFCGNKPYDVTYGPCQEACSPKELSRDEKFPDTLAALLEKCVQWEPQSRYSSFKEIRLELMKTYKSLFDQGSPFAELDLLDLEAGGLNNRGVAYYELGRKEDAFQCWEKSLTMNQIHPEATYNLSLIQWRDTKIVDNEVLRRLDYCGNDPMADKEKLAELKAYIHAERYAPDAARDVLKKFPGKNEAVFSDNRISHISCLHILKGHINKVNTVSLSSDGRFAVSGGDDKTLRMWDLETGHCLRTMTGHTDWVGAVTFTPDSRHAVSCGDKTLRMWDLETGQCLHTMEESRARVISVSITPDGRRAISGSMDHSLRVWDLETGNCLRTMQGHTKGAGAICLTQDGRYAVSGSYDKTLRIWDMETGECLRTMEGHTDDVKTLVLTSDGRCAVSGSNDKTLRMWDIETGQCLQTLEGHTKKVLSVALTPDSRFVVSGSEDETIRKWDLETGQCVRTITGHTSWVNSVSLISAGQCAVSGSYDHTLRLWDLETGQCLRTMEGHRYYVNSVILTPDEQYAVSASHDGTLRIWAIDTSRRYHAELVVSLPRGFEQRKKEEETLSVDIGEAEKLFNMGNYGRSYAFLFKVWNAISFAHNEEISNLYLRLLEKGRIKGLTSFALKRMLKGHTKSLWSIAFTADGRFGISGSTDNTLRMWNLVTGQCVRTMKGHTNWVKTIVLAKDDRYALSGSNDNTLRIWDLETGRCLHIMEGHTGMVTSVCITPDGRHAVSGGHDKTMLMWDLETGQCIRTLEGHTNNILSICLTTDGRHAISASEDKTLRKWNLETGQCEKIMEKHVNGITSVSLTPDGLHVVSGSRDTALLIWDFKTGQWLNAMLGHTSWITSVALTPDGRYAVSGGEDNTIRMWDIKTCQCLRTLEGHTSSVDAIALIANGRYAVSSGRDDTLRMWDLESGRCLCTLEGYKGSVTPNGRYAITGDQDNALRVWEFVWDLEFDGETEVNT